MACLEATDGRIEIKMKYAGNKLGARRVGVRASRHDSLQANVPNITFRLLSYISIDLADVFNATNEK